MTYVFGCRACSWLLFYLQMGAARWEIGPYLDAGAPLLQQSHLVSGIVAPASVYSLHEADDVDPAMQYLIDQAGPEDQERLSKMDPAERRQMAETAYNDPDTAEQIWRRRKSKQRES